MRLFITVKRSTARDIASILPGTRQSYDSHINVGNDLITWCNGRLLELCEPDAYDSRWARWDAKTLPIRVPYDNWRLTPKLDKNTKQIDASTKKRLAAIKLLLEQASIVVNAEIENFSEGHILIDDVIDYFGYRGKIMRLRLQKSSISIETIESSMQENSIFQHARHAELCRSRANWLIGKNMTRAVTKLLASDQIIPIGRIQTPMLSLIVHRCMVIENQAEEHQNYYTEQTLIREMLRYVRCGASDLESLKARGFINITGGKIKDTPLGRATILALPTQLTDTSVASAWEKALNQIAAGDYQPEEFMRRLDIYVRKNLDEIKASAGIKFISPDSPMLPFHPNTKSEQLAHTSDK